MQQLEVLNPARIGRAREIREVVVGPGPMPLEEFVAAARYGAAVSLSAGYVERVLRSRALVEKILDENRPVYGLTTGFGDNVRKLIPQAEAEVLQVNILRSHSVSVGSPLSAEGVRATWLMQLLSLGAGFSGIRLEMLELIVACLNAGVVPYAPEEGSIQSLPVEGAINLVLMGEGQAYYKGKLLPGGEALVQAGLKPLSPACKEGLCLTNGINGATALAALALYDSLVSAQTADVSSAMFYETMKATIMACDERLHSLKIHSEQRGSAANIRNLLADSGIMAQYKHAAVQDAYITRSIPQTHGAAKRFVKNAYVSIVREMASCNDNPILWPQDGDDGIALMGANFDGTFSGGYADVLCMASGILGKFSERRTDRLTNRNFSGGYPPFLASDPGLESGYMIIQYTAAALVGEIRGLCIPATGDSIPVSANWEDPISMAWWAAVKATQVAKKLQYILAIELMTMSRAFDLSEEQGEKRFAQATKSVRDRIRKDVPLVRTDRHFGPDIETIYELVKEGEILRTAQSVIGTLEF